MKITMSDKVVNFMNHKNIPAIFVIREVMSGGWAGPREAIRGEFIKDEKTLAEIDKGVKKGEFKQYDVKGVKVFTTKSLDAKILYINSSLSLFNMFMMLGIDIER